mmetsp:Transcript_33332/g.86495  ORF Transcript_33332/g.86495 Transcript_33332/m.86495 type:complete len:202 (+) Transcript_33332:738-1343(+)
MLLRSRLVTSVTTISLFSSCFCCWHETCLMAVRKDCGLNNREISVTFGKVNGSALQSNTCSTRSLRLISHEASGRLEGNANFCHLGGIFSSHNECISCSICSLIVSSPRNPCCNSPKDLAISPTKMFIYSHSCSKTNWYGPLSSSAMAPAMSSTGSFTSPISSRMSTHCFSAPLSLETASELSTTSVDCLGCNTHKHENRS